MEAALQLHAHRPGNVASGVAEGCVPVLRVADELQLEGGWAAGAAGGPRWPRDWVVVQILAVEDVRTGPAYRTLAAPRLTMSAVVYEGGWMVLRGGP